MARIAYALTSQGMGHTSRSLVLGAELRRLGHEVLFFCGGRAAKVLRDAGSDVFEMPVTGHHIRDNKLQHIRSLILGLSEQFKNRNTRYAVMDEMRRFGPDLLVNDFEMYTGPAALDLGLPIITLNHGQVLTHTEHRVPLRYCWDAFVARGVVRHVLPERMDHSIITAWEDRPVTAHDTTVVGPIIRSAVVEAIPVEGDAVLVYHNDPTYLSLLIPLLGALDAPFIVYRPAALEGLPSAANVTFRDYDPDTFIEDLIHCRAVISSAGFNLMSECLWLKKPLYVIPNRGQYEQTYNALELVDREWGEACFEPLPTAEGLKGFLERLPQYTKRVHALRLRPGARRAVECIHRVMRHPAPNFTVPAMATGT